MLGNMKYNSLSKWQLHIYNVVNLDNEYIFSPTYIVSTKITSKLGTRPHEDFDDRNL